MRKKNYTRTRSKQQLTVFANSGSRLFRSHCILLLFVHYNVNRFPFVYILLTGFLNLRRTRIFFQLLLNLCFMIVVVDFFLYRFSSFILHWIEISSLRTRKKKNTTNNFWLIYYSKAKFSFCVVCLFIILCNDRHNDRWRNKQLIVYHYRNFINVWCNMWMNTLMKTDRTISFAQYFLCTNQYKQIWFFYVN